MESIKEKNNQNKTKNMEQREQEQKKQNKIDYIKLVESPFFKKLEEKKISEKNVDIGDVVRIGYTLYEGTKEKIQYYEGIIIAKNNKQLGKSFTIRRNVQGIGVEQIFCLYSPKIISISRKQASKVRRAKLYFLRLLVGKKTKLKRKL